MGQPVVHFEIIGADPERLRSYHSALFAWKFDDSPVAGAVSDAGRYGFIEPVQPEGVGIPGDIGGGGRTPRAMFYVGVDDVESALQNAERLGGKRVLGPAANPNGRLVVGHFTDIEGNLIGVAGPK